MATYYAEQNRRKSVADSGHFLLAVGFSAMTQGLIKATWFVAEE